MRDYSKEHTGALHGKYGNKGHPSCPGCMTKGMHLSGSCVTAYSYGPHLRRLCPLAPDGTNAFDSQMKKDVGL